MTGITIQEGKFYRCVDGQVIGPFKRNSIAPLSNPYQWRANDREWTYTCDGKLWVGYPSSFDLVEEAPDPNAKQEARMSEPEFKVGDRVRRVDQGCDRLPIGYECTVDLRPYAQTSFWCKDAIGADYFTLAKNWELVQPASPPSPIRTKTVKEIVRGKYGCVEIGDVAPEGVSIWLPTNARYTAADLTKIIDVLTPVRDALADALDEQ